MRKNFFYAALPLALAFTFISCSPEEVLESPTAVIVTPTENYIYNTDESDLEATINDYRASIGLSTLQSIEYVSYKAEAHNQYMIAHNAINHDFFEERSQNIIEVVGAVRVNENVAYNYVSAHAVLQAWLASPAHKANIEGDFTHIGISIRQNSGTGKKYYTNIFVKK